MTQAAYPSVITPTNKAAIKRLVGNCQFLRALPLRYHFLILIYELKEYMFSFRSSHPKTPIKGRYNKAFKTDCAKAAQPFNLVRYKALQSTTQYSFNMLHSPFIQHRLSFVFFDSSETLQYFCVFWVAVYHSHKLLLCCLAFHS